MNNYICTDVFITYNKIYEEGSVAYLSRGVAIDNIRNGKVYSNPSKETLCYEEGTDFSKVNTLSRVTGIDAVTLDKLYCTDWYPTGQINSIVDALNEEQYNKGVGVIHTGYLKIPFNQKSYRDVVYPCIKYLKYNSKGVLRNNHVRKPNVFGLHDNISRMVFYPDRRCQNLLWEGKAIVYPTYVCKDYGFIDCRMVLRNPANASQVCSYLNKQVVKNKSICMVSIPGYGKYYCKVDNIDTIYVSGVFYEFNKGHIVAQGFKMSLNFFNEIKEISLDNNDMMLISKNVENDTLEFFNNRFKESDVSEFCCKDGVIVST